MPCTGSVALNGQPVKESSDNPPVPFLTTPPTTYPPPAIQPHIIGLNLSMKMIKPSTNHNATPAPSPEPPAPNLTHRQISSVFHSPATTATINNPATYKRTPPKHKNRPMRQELAPQARPEPLSLKITKRTQIALNIHGQKDFNSIPLLPTSILFILLLHSTRRPE
jgi:hypothetical protein